MIKPFMQPLDNQFTKKLLERDVIKYGVQFIYIHKDGTEWRIPPEQLKRSLNNDSDCIY